MAVKDPLSDLSSLSMRFCLSRHDRTPWRVIAERTTTTERGDSASGNRSSSIKTQMAE